MNDEACIEANRIRGAIISWSAMDGWQLEYELPESNEFSIHWINLPDTASDAEIISWLGSNELIQESGLTGRIHLWRGGKPTGLRIGLAYGQVATIED